MRTYLNTARHPIDLGTGAFAAPQQQVAMEPNPTIDEHLQSGRLVELVHVVAPAETVSIDIVKAPKSTPAKPARSTGKTEEE